MEQIKPSFVLAPDRRSAKIDKRQLRNKAVEVVEKL